jgi:hypothetical protein
MLKHSSVFSYRDKTLCKQIVTQKVYCVSQKKRPNLHLRCQPLAMGWPIQASQQRTEYDVAIKQRKLFKGSRHGLINYIDTKAKWRHLKILTLRQVFIRYSQPCWHFRPSYYLSDLLSGSTFPLLPTLPCLNENSAYAYAVCKGGWGTGLWASGR